jgi:spore maturation protein CgeB
MFYRPGDKHDMCQQVEHLLAHESLRAHITTNGLRQVAQRSWSTLTDELVQHYRNVSHRLGIREAA